LVTPSIATLLGRWFWWPQVVHPRGDNARPQRVPQKDNIAPQPVVTQR
jgi:putative drug exporter of the RND superfamily